MDSTISTGDILSVVIILTGIVALFFQARSVRLSEKQLGLNIEDVKVLSLKTQRMADDLRKEQETIKKMSIEKMMEYANLTNYTTDVRRDVLTFSRSNQAQMHEYVICLCLVTRWLLDNFKEGDRNLKNSKWIAELGDLIKHMVSFIAVSEAWFAELDRISRENKIRWEEIAARNLTADEQSRAFSELQGRFEQRIADTNERFERTTKIPRETFRKAHADLVNHFAAQVKE